MPPAPANQDECLGTFIVSSSSMEVDRLGRVSSDYRASDLARTLRDSCMKQPDFQVHPEAVLAWTGGCQIDCRWNTNQQLALLTNHGDTRLDWLSQYTGEVERIHANAHQPEPKTAAELGISGRRLMFHRALARIHKEERTAVLLLRDINQEYLLPLVTQAEIDAMCTDKDVIIVVNNVVLAVGRDQGHVLVYVRGHNHAIFIDGADEDALHQQRKRGLQVRGILERRDDGREFLVNPEFTTVAEQAKLL